MSDKLPENLTPEQRAAALAAQERAEAHETVMPDLTFSQVMRRLFSSVREFKTLSLVTPFLVA
ncbi:MAG: hypothetical protein IJM67_10990, partial [Atopobiaceae bacterium]|nr:hypothetical protein [Atopobiaceae bacterium]